MGLIMDGWTELTAAKVQASLPTDIGNLYQSWVEGNPSKAGRLAELAAETVEVFRKAVKTQKRVIMDEGAAMIPSTGYPHALNLVVFNLGMEMGVQFAPQVYSLFVQAHIWLRMVQAGTMRPVEWEEEEATAGAPSYERPQGRH
jgi:hypothetical protein